MPPESRKLSFEALQAALAGVWEGQAVSDDAALTFSLNVLKDGTVRGSGFQGSWHINPNRQVIGGGHRQRVCRFRQVFPIKDTQPSPSPHSH